MKNKNVARREASRLAKPYHRNKKSTNNKNLKFKSYLFKIFECNWNV
jgi:hypothetical protein